MSFINLKDQQNQDFLIIKTDYQQGDMKYMYYIIYMKFLLSAFLLSSYAACQAADEGLEVSLIEGQSIPMHFNQRNLQIQHLGAPPIHNRNMQQNGDGQNTKPQDNNNVPVITFIDAPPIPITRYLQDNGEILQPIALDGDHIDNRLLNTQQTKFNFEIQNPHQNEKVYEKQNQVVASKEENELESQNFKKHGKKWEKSQSFNKMKHGKMHERFEWNDKMQKQGMRDPYQHRRREERQIPTTSMPPVQPFGFPQHQKIREGDGCPFKKSEHKNNKAFKHVIKGALFASLLCVFVCLLVKCCKGKKCGIKKNQNIDLQINYHLEQVRKLQQQKIRRQQQRRPVPQLNQGINVNQNFRPIQPQQQQYYQNEQQYNPYGRFEQQRISFEQRPNVQYQQYQPLANRRDNIPIGRPINESIYSSYPTL